MTVGISSCSYTGMPQTLTQQELVFRSYLGITEAVEKCVFASVGVSHQAGDGDSGPLAPAHVDAVPTPHSFQVTFDSLCTSLN